MPFGSLVTSVLGRHLYTSEISLVDWLDGGPGCKSGSMLGYSGLILWIIFSLFLFVGIYVLCEEYFVPLLTVLGEKMKLPQDVLGATLLAVGGSSPELFTALIGVFLYPTENPGPATNCGSNAFNMCVIIGLSVLFCGRSKLTVAGYPFIRDTCFYMLVAVELYMFYEWTSPGLMEIWESFLLVLTWVIYVVVLYNNEKIVQGLIRIFELLNLPVPSSLLYLSSSEDLVYCGKQSGLLEKVLPTSSNGTDALATVGGYVDMHMEYEDIKSESAEATEDNTSELSLFLSNSSAEEDHGLDLPSNGYQATSALLGRPPRSTKKYEANIDYDTLDTDLSTHQQFEHSHENALIQIMRDAQTKSKSKSKKIAATPNVNQHSPCMISKMPPNTHRRDGATWGKGIASMEIATATAPPAHRYEPANTRVWKWMESRWNKWMGQGARNFDPAELYVFGKYLGEKCTLPFRAVFALTVPSLHASTNYDDVTNRHLAKIFAACILWLALLTFLVVDCANKIGVCCGLTAQVMGLTLLAIGTSLPDCVSSVLVAKNGKGTMAMSSALGGNVFDIGICAGLSFFLKSLLSGGQPIRVEGGANYEAFMSALFLLLALLIFCMYHTNLELTKQCGYMLLGSYVIFLLCFSVLLDL